ncbi:polycystic kidney disease 2-like 1 protein [Stylonychia lemnae]|uniref:Polycystic kidney disease 2-like 1 protein n=1 Tax=Stylonychia lemnae TaxID=5949 RepID=A0A078AND3_STYLE|nr:polycystic kidney disease 2-like 1 protein [Stylonychia lemnae]|eukprot:CDW82453.1 polycystic kidney disease 2-like 1 protein [Stylonychia lemnae]
MNDDDSHENEKKDDSNQNQSSSIFSVANSFVQHKNGKAARQLSLGSQALKPKIMINNEDLDSFDEGLNSNQKILELSDEDEYQGDQDNESMSKVSFKSDHLRQYPAKLSSRKAGTPQIIVEGSQQDATKILNTDSEMEGENLGQNKLRDLMIDQLRHNLKASSVFTLGVEDQNYLRNQGTDLYKTNETLEQQNSVAIERLKTMANAFMQTKTKIMMRDDSEIVIPKLNLENLRPLRKQESDRQPNEEDQNAIQNDDFIGLDGMQSPERNENHDSDTKMNELDVKNKSFNKTEQESFDQNKREEEIKKLQKDAQETDQDEDEGGRQGALSNLFYLLTSFVFIIIFVTQFDLTAQQRQSYLLTTLLDTTVFDFQLQHVRQDAGSAGEIYQYLKDCLIPLIYDEVQKKSNGIFNNTQSLTNRYNQTLSNETEHYLGLFTYYVGMRISLKQSKYYSNGDSQSQKVLPEIVHYKFDIDAALDDQRETITSPKTGQNYVQFIFLQLFQQTYEEESGPRFTGAYPIYFKGQMTYKEAKDQIIDLFDSGFFDEHNFLYIAVEILTYNEGYKLFSIQTFYKYIREYIKRKELNIQWYDYIDSLAIAFCLQSMYYWFILYARKDIFNIPIGDINEFTKQIQSRYYIQQYLNSSSIAVVLLCIKNLRILMIFFPSFGVLFDTFRRAKSELFYFFTMSIVFLIGFLFAGNSLFGSLNADYKDLGTSMMSLFRMLVGEFKYKSLQASNPEASILFFIIYVVFFFIILLNLLLTIVIKVYDSLRQKKALDSMAKAKIISRENYAYFQKWLDLLLCRMKGDQELDTESEGSDLEDQNQLSSISNQQRESKSNLKELLRARILQKIEQKRQQEIGIEKKKDIKTIFLHNKAKLFQSGKMLKTKEQMENELALVKKQIIEKKVQEREARIRRFQTTDIKGVLKLRSSIVYLLFIINFVVMLSLQLQITDSGQAQKSLKSKIQTQNFTNLQLYTPFDPDHSLFKQYPTYYEQYRHLTNLTVSKIFHPNQMSDWLYTSLHPIIYGSADQTILRQNHLFGKVYAKLTFRKIKMRQNKNDITKNVIQEYRSVDLLDFTDGVKDDEVTTNFRGSRSNRTYQYFKPGNINTYEESGGFLLNLPSNSSEAKQILYDFINDRIIDETLAYLSIEFVTYNQAYHVYVLSTITFQQEVSGIIMPLVRCRTIRKNLYVTRLDQFRLSQELLYAILILFYLSVEIRDYIREWITVVKMVKQVNVIYIQDNKDWKPEYSQIQPNCFERTCVFLGINYQYVINKTFVSLLLFILNLKIFQVILFLYLMWFSLIWFLRQIIRFLRVLLRYISSDFFKLFNLVSISISLTLIGTWIYIIASENFFLDQSGNVVGASHNQIDLLSNLADYYDTYNFYSSINTIIIFWRILQFFSFSFKLSAFTEILSASKNDVLFFMLMFIICLFGYAVMGYSIFGQSSRQYSNIFFTIIEQFKMMIEYFDYDSMKLWNPTFAPAFFISFMLLFDQFMKNMFIAIIMAHYSEFQSFSNFNQDENDSTKRKNQFNKLLFGVVKSALCPDFLIDRAVKKKGKFWIWYTSNWEKLEGRLFKPTQETNDDNLTEEIKELHLVLTSRYLRPTYDKKDIPNSVKPYLFSEYNVQDDDENRRKNEDDNEDSKLPDNSIQDGRFHLDPEELKMAQDKKDKAKQKEYDLKYGGDNVDNQALMVNYINIIPKNFEGLTDDELTSSNVWVAALENLLFQQSQKSILYSDLHEMDQLLGNDLVCMPIYDIDQFSSIQAEFLMKDEQQRIQAWKLSNTDKKLKLWVVLDFEKVFEDENKYRDEFNERLESFHDIINEMKKDYDFWEKEQQKSKHQTNRSNQEKDLLSMGIIKRREQMQKIQQQLERQNRDLIKQVPVLTFKKIIKSPELQDPEFLKVSALQKNLWINYTTHSEKFNLWFNCFSPYYRTKLWNSLSFSEDYVIGIVNTTKYFRQDVALKTTIALQTIKKEYRDYLEREIRKNQDEFDSLKAMSDHKVIHKQITKQRKAISKMRELVDKIESSQIKLEDIAKKATYKIRNRHFSSGFFLDVLEMLQLKKFKIFKKIKNDSKSKKLFDQIDKEQQLLKLEEAQTRLKMFTKKKTDSIQEESEYVRKRTPKKIKIEENKYHHNDKQIMIKQAIQPKLFGLGKSRTNHIIQLGSFGGPGDLNATNDQFERSNNDSVVQGLHTRGPSQIPILQKIQTVQSPSSYRNLMAASETNQTLSDRDKSQQREMFLKNIKSMSKDDDEIFEVKKVSPKIYIETLKSYFGTMIYGVKGDRISNLNQYYPITKGMSQEGRQRQMKHRYTYLVQSMDINEQRLPLWLCMSQDDKLRMLAFQHIEGEAQTMSLLITEEIERMQGSKHKIADLDRKLERTLDNQIYEKYRRLTEWQALKTTSINAEKRLQRLQEEDGAILNLIEYLTDKGQDLQIRQQQLFKDIMKRYKENQIWRQQYESKPIDRSPEK